MNLFDEDLSQEKGQIIFAMSDEDTLIACLMLKQISETRVKLRQMGVKESYQGQCIGTKLVEYAENWCRKNGINEIETHAREYAQEFYLKLGYEIQGERFLEINIPHRFMFKNLGMKTEQKINNKGISERPGCNLCRANSQRCKSRCKS